MSAPAFGTAFNTSEFASGVGAAVTDGGTGILDVDIGSSHIAGVGSGHPGFALGAAGGDIADQDSPSRAEKSLGILTSKVREKAPCC